MSTDNSIFSMTPEQAAASGIQVQSISKQAAEEIPMLSVQLPSKGLVYPETSPFHNQEFIDIKAMTAREENLLMSKALARSGTMIQELIKSCMINKSADVNELISGDRNALLIYIRSSGYGTEYTTKVVCPNCEETSKFDFDLGNLSLKELDFTKINQVKPFENLFSFRLPRSGKVIEFKFLTGKDDDVITAMAEARKKTNMKNDELVTTRLVHSIVSVDGKTDKMTITSTVNNMLALDARALRKHIDDNEPSVDMTQPFTCPKCGVEEEVQMPLGISFLWPDLG